MAKMKSLANVQFGKFDWPGGKTCSLKVKLEFEVLQIDANFVCQNFVESRIECCIGYSGGGDNEGGQQTLKDEKYSIDNVIATIHSASIKKVGEAGFTLSFSVKELDKDALAKFMDKGGWMRFERIGASVEPKADAA